MPTYTPDEVYPVWDEEIAYAKGDVVRYEGYLYLAMDATEAGDNPRTAVKDFEFTNTVNNGFFQTPPPTYDDPVDVSMRLWTIFDYPVSVYYARLRGLKDTTLQKIDGLGSDLPSNEGYHTISVQNGWYYSVDSDEAITDTEYPRMQPPSTASWEGYGMPGGMTAHYNIKNDTEDGDPDWIYGPSSVLREAVVDAYGAPKSYGHTYENPTTQFGTGNGVCYGPSYISPMERNAGLAIAPFPDLAENSYGIFAAMCQFSRDYTFTNGTPPMIGFEDQYVLDADAPAGGVLLSTDPDMATGL
jgi:hypothetical protein